MKLPRWFYHSHYEWHVLGLALTALVVIKIYVGHLGAMP